jgi:hypothetical protein
MESRWYAGFAFAGPRAGIMTAGTVFGAGLRRLLAQEAGGSEDRDDSDPE